MKYKTSETLINSMGVEVYPITLIKFLLNKRKILSYFQNIKKENFIIKFKQTLSSENCEENFLLSISLVGLFIFSLDSPKLKLLDEK